MLPVLSIAGSDSGGGAGLQQDLKVFSVFGVYGCTVVTALTAQNTLGVHGVFPVAPTVVRAQLDAVLDDIRPRAVKTGMLAGAEIVREVAKALAERNPDTPVVVDPVMVAKGGQALLPPDAVDALKRELLPRANVITPNIPEAEALLGRTIRSPAGMRAAAQDLLALLSTGPGPRAVILKGGHLAEPDSTDIVVSPEGTVELGHPRIPTRHTHGTGCAFSAALTVLLAKGHGVEEAARAAKGFVTRAIEGAVHVGHGINPVNPLAAAENDAARYTVLQALETAWKRLSAVACRPLVPEVQMNLGYALPWSVSEEDIAAFPGRIVGLGEGVARVRAPAFGASSHVARILLTVARYDRTVRSAMNCRHDFGYLRRAKELGLVAAEFSRQDEPEEVRRREGSTLVWGVGRTIERAGRVPDIIHDAGSLGKEPMIRILGPDPVTVVEKALRMAGMAGTSS